MTKLTFAINESDLEHLPFCIACGEMDFSLISDCTLPDQTKFFSTSICNRCGHVFRNIRPSTVWFKKNFKKRHDFQKDLGLNPISPAIEEQRYQRYFAIGSMIKKMFPRHTSFLDVGCGPGTGFDALRELGFESEGIESDESRSIIAKEKGFKIFEGDWKEYGSQEKFDVISSIHSLEHFHNPGMCLEKFRNLAHDETLLYIEVPHILDHVKDWNDSLYLAHLSNFQENSLVTLAEKSGWNLVARVHPYSNTSLYKNHLSFIFRLSHKEFSGSPLTPAQVKNFLKPAILEAYRKNLPPLNDDFQSVHFIVKEINDLSLTFKGNLEIKEVVHDNYQGRIISKGNGNQFSVS